MIQSHSNPNKIALWTLLLSLACGSNVLADHYDSPEISVEAARDSLDHGWGGAPWYDSQTDGVRRVEVKAPTTPTRAPGTPSISWFGEVARFVGWSLLVLTLAILIWMVVRAFLDAEVATVRGTGSVETDAVANIDRVEALPFMASRPQSDLLGEARRHYLDGNFSEAIIYLFSYQLVELDKGQLIRLTRGKTNRQYLREVSRSSSLGNLLEQTMVAFEDVFFGKHPLLRPRFENCWNQLDDFHRQLQKVMPT